MDLKFRSGWKAMDGETEWLEPERVVYAKSPQGLIQAAGYAKHILGRKGMVFYRGQQSNYATMYPSLYRQKGRDKNRKIISKVITDSGKRKRSDVLDAIILKLQNSGAFLENTPEFVTEGILQHYGLNTRYIDIVDNLWSALWFSCHSMKISTHSSNLMHIVRSNKPYSYVYLLALGKIKKLNAGVYETYSNVEIVDLRIAAPSLYLRPHAQHGLVAKRINRQMYSKSDFMECVGLTIKVDTENALKWIGSGELLMPGSMYPSAFFDSGYAVLMSYDELTFYEKLIEEKLHYYKSAKKMREVFGSIKNVSY
ncbi:FRG domain-containing protein [Oceanidesulfovibrio marinus]|uniref:FRG domain-containing protein n=1 Tax=Oceanidesulfovibrio marinus TaxID=370038 RepID=A0ABX6NFW3_9BACT|nr:FRG domain-containing protein [Oceanidesulfovibrio marinus]QJT09499.1 FRG domain-containing protein [Oceanidesulfovibrio marinus]